MNVAPDRGLELELVTAALLHDLRGVLGIAKGLAFSAVRLIENGRSAEAIAMLHRLDHATVKGAELCADVLECSRRHAIGEGSVVAREELDLVALAHEQLSLHAVAISERGSKVELRLAKKGPVQVRTHRRSVERVLANLLQNAARYGAGRPIDIHVSGNPRGSVLIVRDRGAGIPPEDLSRVFSPYRTKGEVDLCFERFGLGLWIVQHLVRSIGGTLHVASEPDAGTAITVVFPAERTPVRPALIAKKRSK